MNTYVLTNGTQEVEMAMPLAYALASSGYIVVTSPPSEPIRRFEVAPDHTWDDVMAEINGWK